MNSLLWCVCCFVLFNAIIVVLSLAKVFNQLKECIYYPLYNIDAPKIYHTRNCKVCCDDLPFLRYLTKIPRK